MLLVVFYSSPEDSLKGTAVAPRDTIELLEHVGSKATWT